MNHSNNITMKLKVLLVCMFCIFFCSNITHAQTQSLTIEAAQNITNFTFKNSDGVKDKNYEPSFSGGYALGYAYKLTNIRLYFTGKIGMRSAGASYVYDGINYNWNLKYFETRLGIGYDYDFGKFGTHFAVQPYFGYLLKGNQRLNNEDFNLKTSGALNKADAGLFISPGVNFQASDFISMYLDLNYMFGFYNLESNAEQVSRNNLYGANLGLAFTIK